MVVGAVFVVAAVDCGGAVVVGGAVGTIPDVVET